MVIAPLEDKASVYTVWILVSCCCSDPSDASE